MGAWTRARAGKVAPPGFPKSLFACLESVGRSMLGYRNPRRLLGQVSHVGPLPSRHMSDRLLRTQKTRSDLCFRRLIRTKCCPAARHLSGSTGRAAIPDSVPSHEPKPIAPRARPSIISPIGSWRLIVNRLSNRDPQVVPDVVPAESRGPIGDAARGAFAENL